MRYRIEVKEKPSVFDSVGEGIKKDILDLGFSSVSGVSFIQVYLIDGDLSEQQLNTICEELLSDKITQEYFTFTQPAKSSNHRAGFVVEIAYNPGVMDPSEESIIKGIRDLGIKTITAVKTAKRYLFEGKLTDAQLKTISEKLLYNKLIQHVVKVSGRETLLPQEAGEKGFAFKPVIVDLLGVSDVALRHLSKAGQLFLNQEEMSQIQGYFKKLKRNPTDLELETIAQTWSEHCWHKTFRGRIDYKERINTLGYKSRVVSHRSGTERYTTCLSLLS